MADRRDLGSRAVRREGSSPSFPIILFTRGNILKIDTKKLKDNRIEAIIEMDPEKYRDEKHIAAKKISKNSKIPGFRPGKAPYDVVERIYGEELIEEQALENAINKVYKELIETSDIHPYGPGKLDEIISKDPPKFRFLIPLQPMVDLGNYESIRHPYKEPKIKKDEINKVVEEIRLNYSTAEEVDRKCEAGDLVSLKINAELKKPEEGEDSKILNNTPHQVIIGEDDSEDGFPFPGFSKKIEGASFGDTVEFTYKYSKDSKFENLQNKEVAFSATIENVKKLIKPELDDEFAKRVGFETLGGLTESVEEQLKTARLNEYDNQYFDELLEKIIKKADIKYPPEMLEDEIADVLKNFEQDLAERNLDLETYLKLNKREREEFIEKEIKPTAKKRLEQALVIEEISRKEEIELDQAELQREYTRQFSQMRSASNFDQLRREFTTKKLSDALVMQSATRLMNRRTLERIKEIASGEAEKAAKTSEINDDKDSETEDGNSNKNMIEDN